MNFPDPAAAPLGTDAEASGNPPTREELEIARREEIDKRPDEKNPPSPGGRPVSAGQTEVMFGTGDASRGFHGVSPASEEKDMVTTVGTENDLKALVKSFIQLEHDAIAAYETCIDKLEAPNRKEKVREFLGDHERHLRELEDLAREVGAYDPRRR